MRMRGWGLGNRRGRRKRDPASSAGAKEISQWLSSTAPPADDDDRPNPYLPAGTPQTWADQDDRTLLGPPRRRKAGAATVNETPYAPEWLDEERQAKPTPTRTAKPPRTTPAPTPRAGSRPKPKRPARSKRPAGSARSAGRRGGSPRASRIVWSVLTVGVAVAAGVALASHRSPPGDLGGPAIPNASTEVAELVALDPVWSAYPRQVMYGGIAGGGSSETPFVATEGVVVVRQGESRYDDETVYSVLALDRATGNIAWRFGLDGAVCAEDLLAVDGDVAAAAGTDQVLVCAGDRPSGGTDPAGHRLVLVDPATGQIGLDRELTQRPAALATAADGIVLRDALVPAIGGRAAELGVRWLDASGEELWHQDLITVSEELADRFADPDAVLYSTEWARVADVLLLNLSWSLFVLDGDGVHQPVDAGGDPVECYSVALTGDSFVCDSWRGAMQIVRHAPTGEWQQGWLSSGELVSAGELVAPVPLAATSSNDVTTISRLDPGSGAVGAEVARLSGYSATVHGTREVPLVRGREALVRLSADGASGVWRRPWSSDYGALGLFVAGDRIVLPDYTADLSEDIVLDAADGREIARIREGSLVPLEGRLVLNLSYQGVRLLELP